MKRFILVLDLDADYKTMLLEEEFVGFTNLGTEGTLCN